MSGIKKMKCVWIVILGIALGFGISANATAEDKVTITVMRGQPPTAEVGVYDKIAAEYMDAHPDVEIKFQYGPRSATKLLGLYLQHFEVASDEVDVLAIDVTWPGDLANHLVDLYQYNGVKDTIAEHFSPIVENNTVSGSLVAIPWYTDAGLLYYRTDLLEKYGYAEPPKTWDELQEMAVKIQAGERKENADFWGFVWQGKAYEGLTCDALEWVYSHEGGSIIEPDGTLSIENEMAVEALERAQGWIGAISPPGVTGFMEEDARGMWQAGNAAFMRNWPYCFSLGNKDDSIIRGKFDVAPLPGIKAGLNAGTLGGWQMAVSKYSNNIDIAVDVAKYLTSKKVQKIMSTELAKLPTIQALYNDPTVLEAHPFMKSLYPVFTNAVARPSTVTAPNYNQVSTLFFKAVHNVLIDKKDAQTAIEELALDLEELL